MPRPSLLSLSDLETREDVLSAISEDSKIEASKIMGTLFMFFPGVLIDLINQYSNFCLVTDVSTVTLAGIYFRNFYSDTLEKPIGDIFELRAIFPGPNKDFYAFCVVFLIMILLLFLFIILLTVRFCLGSSISLML